MQFKDKSVVVTGGSKGIGKAIALAFAEQGAKVAISARNQAELDAAAAEIESAGGQALAVVCDVTDDQQVAELAAKVTAAFDVVDILVNNAGIAASHKFLDHPDKLWHKVLDVNLTGVYRVCKAFVPAMVARKSGRIINMASVASKIASPYMAAYTTSKHGLLGLTRSLAVELNPFNITVNAICPGYVDTPMVEGAIAYVTAKTGQTPDDARKVIESTNPQKRLIDAAEVAALTLMLAGEAARSITGQAINVDGGAVMW
ncbi:MAG: SDR family oxidoreductase [Anaerolineae bacterium]|nr:SDR family oxidoreductase [Anaerolineae bacterium]